MPDPLILRAGLAGLALALAAGPLGCVVVWRRMAYFGDATAHASILGVALALALDLPLVSGVLAVVLLVALAVAGLGGRLYATDTLLGVAAHGGLALGVVAVSLTGGRGLDLESYLFGDILTVGWRDLAVIGAAAAAALGLLAWRWSAIVTASLSPELARASGLDPDRERLILTLALALLIAVALKIVGALLITAMLVIPAAAVRPFVRGPEAMAVSAAGAGVLSVILGLQASWSLDTPTGPSIVTAAVLLFAAAQAARPLLKTRA